MGFGLSLGETDGNSEQGGSDSDEDGDSEGSAAEGSFDTIAGGKLVGRIGLARGKGMVVYGISGGQHVG